MTKQNFKVFDSPKKAADLYQLGIVNEIDLYVHNTNSCKFQKLTTGQIQTIFSAHPQKACISLDEGIMAIINSKPALVRHQQLINHKDIWLDESDYKKITEVLNKPLLGVDEDHPDYAPQLDKALIVYTAAINDPDQTVPLKKRLEKHAKKFYPDMPTSELKRLLVIANSEQGKKLRRPKLADNNH